MKKILYLLAAIMLPLTFTSCHSDDDLPNVSINMEVSGATNVDNTLYVVKGTTLHIDSVDIKDLNGKGAMIGEVTYFFDYINAGTAFESPFSFSINTAGLPAGNHLLQARMSIYAVNSSVATGWVERDVVIVDSPEDIPGGSVSTQSVVIPVQVASADATTSRH